MNCIATKIRSANRAAFLTPPRPPPLSPHSTLRVSQRLPPRSYLSTSAPQRLAAASSSSGHSSAVPNQIYEKFGVTDVLKSRPFSLPELPFDPSGGVKGMSEETFAYHYGKHHATYVRKLNDLVKADDKLQGKSLEDLIKTSQEGSAVFNNAAQIWNHSFFWNCLSVNGGGRPTGGIRDAIAEEWGDFESFKKAFIDKSVAHFGSGWCWLVKEPRSRKLSIVDTHDAATPIRTQNSIPLLVADLWEHAYYIDHKNARPVYLEKFFELINWDFVNAQLKKERL